MTDKKTIKFCMERINDKINLGPLPGNGTDQTAERNGLIIAYNTLAKLIEAKVGDEVIDPTDQCSKP